MALRPGPRLLPALGVWALAALGLVAWPEALPLWAGLGALILLLALVEAGLLLRQALPDIQRELPSAIPLGEWREIALLLDNPGKRPLHLQLVDYLPAAAEHENLQQSLLLPAGKRLRTHYRLRFNRRGDHTLPGVELLLAAPLGLLRRRAFVKLEATARVYPNFAAVAKYALLANDNRLSQLGVRLRQRRGTGLEFHQLREYRDGDTLRQIDWKASSRLRKLITREYQDERDQQVCFLLDSGFRMRSQDGRLSHFDDALNALLLLAYVVLRQGDAAGLLSFAGEERFLPPAKGRGVISHIMNRVYDLEPGTHTPDFLAAGGRLSERLRKRSLVIILTSLRNEDASELSEACRLLSERHLVLVACLREKVLDELDMTEPHDIDSALTVASTHAYLQEREKALNTLRHQGVSVLDVRPDQLAVHLVNRYFDIKRSGRL